jgi:hypothetical protein
MDYTVFYKSQYKDGKIDCGDGYDLFFSGYDGCERTTSIFKSINSEKKIWIKFPHYNVKVSEGDIYTFDSFREDEFFLDLFSQIEINEHSKICIDITGFIRPHLIFFSNYLHRIGIKKIDYLYSEPIHYKNAEETTFSGFIDEVRLIEGCNSDTIIPNTENDLLIITAGYDDKLIAKIAQYKGKIKKKYYILGFPSLQPDMYQENVLKMYQAKESIGSRIDRFAPANDPFVTAQVIDNIVNENSNHSNIYLSPLSTKPQTLGITLYYLWNYQTKPLNIIFPFSNKYHPKTAFGIKRTWKYTFELP